jgi:restriction endonuclease S subunit
MPYDYLMRHFATESGKSKGQFYTPSEVSRVIAKVIGISPQNTKAHAFQSDDIQRQIRDNIGATITQITNKDMNAFRVKLPPEDEQTAIAAVLSGMDAELSALEARRDKTRALKQGMMQELLTGRTRLVTPNEAEMQA